MAPRADSGKGGWPVAQRQGGLGELLAGGRGPHSATTVTRTHRAWWGGRDWDANDTLMHLPRAAVSAGRQSPTLAGCIDPPSIVYYVFSLNCEGFA